MFGLLRITLAALVVISHTVPVGPEFHHGVFAVSIFFMISGYAMTGLVGKRFAYTGFARHFYLERFVRIAPQYYFWLALSCVLSFRLGWAPVNAEGFLPRGLTYYLLIIPLGLQGWLEPLKTNLLAQASSLGIEAVLYLASPVFIKSLSKTWLAGLCALIIPVLTAAGYFPAAQFTYYAFPGAAPLYIIGIFLFRKDWRSVYTYGALIGSLYASQIGQPYNLEMLAGLIAGAAMIIGASKVKQSRLDAALGNAAYGCFLGHGCTNAIFFWYFGHLVADYPVAMRVASVSIACMAGYLSYIIIERPTVGFRRSMKRDEGALALAAVPS